VCDFIALGGQITPPRPKRRACAKISRKNDYKHMSRIINDELYARLVKILAQDEKVAVFQQLVLAPKAELTETAPAEIPPAETTESEVK